jgi:DNA polymerase III delta' subunit
MTGFDDILGQEAAVGWLRRAWSAGRLPHALLFAGPVGVGKATAATALAALFLCEEPGAAGACGACPSCRLIEAGTHPDYHVITKELIRFHDETGKSKGVALSIQVLRPELMEKAGRTAVMGRGKVFVIEQAELMTVGAQNSLLKTLEEPAGRSLIILLTDRPGVLLATIRSRCQLLRFAPLAQPMVVAQLRQRGVEPAAAAQAAMLAEGSLGLALRWLQDGVVDSAGHLLRRLEEHADATESLWPLVRKAADAYAAKQLERDKLSSKDQAVREGLLVHLRIAAGYFRRRLDGAAPTQVERACDAIDAVARAETYLQANVNSSIVFAQLEQALAAP